MIDHLNFIVSANLVDSLIQSQKSPPPPPPPPDES